MVSISSGKDYIPTYELIVLIGWPGVDFTFQFHGCAKSQLSQFLDNENTRFGCEL